MISHTTQYDTARLGGMFARSMKCELFLPVGLDGTEPASNGGDASGDYPTEALTDGDRTSKNQGPAGSPENYINKGQWRSLTTNYDVTQDPSAGTLSNMVAMGGGAELAFVNSAYDQDFDGLSAGNLATQDSWALKAGTSSLCALSAAADYYANGLGVVLAGGAAGASVSVGRAVTFAASGGSLVATIRVEPKNMGGALDHALPIVLYDSGASAYRWALDIYTGGIVRFYNGSTYKTSDYNYKLLVNQKYKFICVFTNIKTASTTVNVFVYDGSILRQIDQMTGLDTTNINEVRFQSSQSSGTLLSYYLDELRLGDSFQDSGTDVIRHTYDVNPPSSDRNKTTWTQETRPHERGVSGGINGFSLTAGTLSFRSATTNAKVGQTVTFTESVTLDRVMLNMGRSSAALTGKIWAEIRTASGNLPTSSVLAVSRPIDASVLTTTLVPTVFDFPYPFIPDGSTQYALVLSSDVAVSVSNYVVIAGSAASSYSAGQWSTYSSATGNWTAAASNDANFIFYTTHNADTMYASSNKDSVVGLRNNAAGGEDGATMVAQSFTVPYDCDVDAVYGFIAKHSGASFIADSSTKIGDRFWCDIHSNELVGGVNTPSSTILGHGVHHRAEIVTWTAFQNFCFSLRRSYRLQAGVVYHVVFKADYTAHATNHIDFGFDGSSPTYTDGNSLYGDASTPTVWTNNTGKDMCFSVVGDYVPFISWSYTTASETDVKITHNPTRVTPDNPTFYVLTQPTSYIDHKATMARQYAGAMNTGEFSPTLKTVTTRSVRVNPPASSTPYRFYIQAQTELSRITISTDPEYGGLKRFRIYNGGSPVNWTQVTNIERVVFREKWNGVGAGTVGTFVAGQINVDPLNTNRPSVPSSIDVFLDGLINFTRLTIVVDDPGLNSLEDGISRVDEVEAYVGIDVSSNVVEIETGVGTDVQQNNVNARSMTMRLNDDGSMGAMTTLADYQRPSTGQLSHDSAPEVILRMGINGELLPVGWFSVDSASRDFAMQQWEFELRARHDRLLFDKKVATWKDNIGYDSWANHIWALANIPEGCTAIDAYPATLPAYGVDGLSGREALQNAVQAMQDRGISVDANGILRSFSQTNAGPISNGKTPPWIFNYIQDQRVFFDPSNERYLWIFEPTASAYMDQLAVWDRWTDYSARTVNGLRSFGGSTTKTPMQCLGRVGTYEKFMLDCTTSSLAGMSYYTFKDGVATAVWQNFTWAQANLSNGVACFIDDILLFTEMNSASQTSGLYYWDVTQPYDAIQNVSAFPGSFYATSIAAIGNTLYVGTSKVVNPVAGDARLYVWPTRTTFDLASMYNAADTYQALVVDADGKTLWGAGFQYQIGAIGTYASISYALKWDTTQAWATKVSSIFKAQCHGAAFAYGGEFYWVDARDYGGIPAALVKWDGDGAATAPDVVAYPGNSETLSTTSGVDLDTAANFNGIAVGSSMYNGKMVLFCIQSGDGTRTTASQYGNLITWPAADNARILGCFFHIKPVAAVETVYNAHVAQAIERTSYEMGGGSSGYNAVDAKIYRHAKGGSGTQYTAESPVLGTNYAIVQLGTVCDPATLGVTAGVTLIRKHAKFPYIFRVTASPAGTLTGQALSSSSVTVRMSQPGYQSLDPNNMNVAEIDNPMVTDMSQAAGLAWRLMQETRSGLSWLTMDLVFHPALELNDILLLALERALLPVYPLTLTGYFRVVNITHNYTAEEARTSVELVKVV